MPQPPEFIETLQHIFRLSEVQARVYGFVLERVDVSAHQISLACRVSRGKIYTVLGSLEARRLIGCIPTHPKRYKPREVAATFASAEKDLLSTAREVARLRETLPRAAEPLLAGPSSGTPIMIRGRTAVSDELHDCIESATHQVQMLSSDNSLARNAHWLVPLLRKRQAELQTLFVLHSGPGPREIGSSIPNGRKTLDATTQALPNDINAYRLKGSNLGVTICVVDESRLLVCRWIPDDLSARSSNDYAITITDSALACLSTTGLTSLRDESSQSRTPKPASERRPSRNQRQGDGKSAPSPGHRRKAVVGNRQTMEAPSKGEVDEQKRARVARTKGD